MKKIIIVISLIFLIVSVIFSQEKLAISAKFDVQRKKIKLVPKTDPVSYKGEDSLRDFLLQQDKYSLFKLTDDLTKLNQNFSALLSNDSPIQCDMNDADCVAISIDLANSNLAPGFYALQISGLKTVTSNTSEYLIFEVGEIPPPPLPETSIVADKDGLRNRIRIKSDKDIIVDKTLTINTKSYNISDDNKSVKESPLTISGTVLDKTSLNPDPKLDKIANSSQTGKEFTILLDKPLSESQTHNLAITQGIKSAAPGNKAIASTKGKIIYPQLPADASELKLENTFSFKGGTNVKPAFNIDFKYDAQNQLPVGNCRLALYRSYPCYFHPKIELAFGFGTSAGENTISLDLPFRTTISLGSKETENATNELSIPNYSGWKKTPRKRGNLYFSAGPKIEADRNFDRVNLLSGLRFDYRSYRFLSSITQKRKLLIGKSSGIEKEIADLVKIDSGNTFIPYFGIDFGESVRAETIEVKSRNLSETIPKYKIFRSYFGFTETLETNLFGFPINLSLEETAYHFATQARIGSTRDEYLNGNLVKVIDIRKVKGFQHYGSLSFDLFFNQMRRYSLNITYENGRKPPELNYLNKVTAGFKIRY